MSCDGNRARFFASLAPTVAPLVGSVEAAKEFLGTLYDVATSQFVPEGKAEQLAAAAATRRMMLLAGRGSLNLYPHTSDTGLPAPEAQAGWKAISDLLDAVERSQPLSPLAVDCQHVAAFQNAIEGRYAWGRQTLEGSHFWGEEVKPETRERLRQYWVADHERIRDLRRLPAAPGRMTGTLGAEKHDAWLAEATELIVADRLLRPSLVTAARHYLTLREAGALEGEQRRLWGRLLAGMAGVGVGPRGVNNAPRSVAVRGAKEWQLCPTCGTANGKGTIHIHPCKPVEAELTLRASRQVADALAHPDFARIDADPSPFATAERIAVGWMQTGQPDPPEGPLRGVLDVLREHDSRMVMRLKACALARPSVLRPELIDTRALRDATIRSPIFIEGVAFIWEGGRLYPQDEYRRRADFGRWAWEGGDLLGPEEHGACAAEVDALTMATVMMGDAVMRDAIRVPGEPPDPRDRGRSSSIRWRMAYRVHELWCAAGGA